MSQNSGLPFRHHGDEENTYMSLPRSALSAMYKVVRNYSNPDP